MVEKYVVLMGALQNLSVLKALKRRGVIEFLLWRPPKNFHRKEIPTHLRFVALSNSGDLTPPHRSL